MVAHMAQSVYDKRNALERVKHTPCAYQSQYPQHKHYRRRL